MKPNIVITSRNKPENINRLLSSFLRTGQIVENIIIIDNSTTKEYQARVKKVCKNYVTSNHERAKFVRTILLD
ncbi:MAG: glycosyltransferase family 2 protein [Candidatus Heimdallarchaeaceae archaeon]